MWIDTRTGDFRIVDHAGATQRLEEHPNETAYVCFSALRQNVIARLDAIEREIEAQAAQQSDLTAAPAFA
jgi:hypothetical protein